MLGDSAYNFVKKSATIILPALGTLYFALAQIWNLSKAEEVMGSIAAINTFLGVVVQVSKKSYYASGAQYAGEIQVHEDDGGKTTASLVVDGDPADILTRKQATFKISDTGETPLIK